MRLMRNAPAPAALDFVPGRRRPGWLGWTLLVAGAVLMLAELTAFAVARADLAEREAIVERLRAAARGGSAQRAAGGAPPSAEELAPALAAAAQLGADWSGALTALAAARPEDVVVIELSGDATRGTLRVVGETQALESAFGFVERLQAGGVLREARIDSHEWVEDRGATALRFTLGARWGRGG